MGFDQVYSSRHGFRPVEQASTAQKVAGCPSVVTPLVHQWAHLAVQLTESSCG